MLSIARESSSSENETYIRTYQRGDEYEIVKVLDEAFNGWPRFDLKCSPLEHWKWKYLDNPLKILILVLVCRIKDDKIIGCNHVIPRKIKLSDKTILSSMGTDVAVDKEFRGMGLTKGMRETRNRIKEKAGIYFNYGGSANQLLIESSKRRGNLPFPHESTTMYRIQDVDLFFKNKKITRKFIKKMGLELVKSYREVREKVRKKKIVDTFEIHQVDNFDDRIVTFWDEIKDYYVFIREQNLEYLNWRFCDKRGGDYRVVVAEKGDRILGYIVLRINKYDEANPEGFIVDLLTLPGRRDVVEGLVENAVDFFDMCGVNTVGYQVIKNHPHRRVLRRYGFVDSRHVLYINIPPVPHKAGLNRELEALHNCSASKVHLSLGDTDWI